uniref:HSF-type DNA-binding domain-containing protein n=1 Tax=Helicotheca tamesis TaxID=374047 RepID=A0A7S2HD95_9STRA
MCLSGPLHRRRTLTPLPVTVGLASFQKSVTAAYSHEQHTVQHNYKDHSNEVEPPKISAALVCAAKSRPKGGVAVPFPLKLHQVLGKIEEDGYGHVISWQPHGRCFVVHKQKEFVEDIMPEYFKQSKFPSFQRQLNLYGFNRLTAGRDKGGYYHEYFLRGKAFLCSRINRMKVKGTGVRMASSPETEPNFYAMTTVGSREPAKEALISTDVVFSSPLEHIIHKSKKELIERRRSSDASFRRFMENLQAPPSVPQHLSPKADLKNPTQAVPSAAASASIVSDDDVLSDDESEPLKTPEMEAFFANFGIPEFSDDEDFMDDTDLGYALDKIIE